MDHTLGTDEGIYCYVEASYPQKEGDMAILISDYLAPVNNGCFELYYFMHGETVGQFNVYMNDTVNGQKLLNNITGEQGFAWKQLALSVTNANEYRIILEGIVSKNVIITQKKYLKLFKYF